MMATTSAPNPPRLVSTLRDARAVLSHSANIELRRVQVEVTEDEVILLGRVSSFYMKQLAQEAVLTLAEGRRIVNLVEVCRN